MNLAELTPEQRLERLEDLVQGLVAGQAQTTNRIIALGIDNSLTPRWGELRETVVQSHIYAKRIPSVLFDQNAAQIRDSLDHLGVSIRDEWFQFHAAALFEVFGRMVEDLYEDSSLSKESRDAAAGLVINTLSAILQFAPE